ncbi:MAG: hypothetical protein K2Q22_11030, partial [Cytophagales bacterium]|nr:hypothetical protein [Cytophagales bacterium]
RINCSGNVPVPLANVTAAFVVGSNTNACYVDPNTGYQWKISNDLVTWNNISGATALTYSPTLTLTTTTYFVRVAMDVCGNTATSNFVTLSVGGAQVPSPTPTVGGTYGYGDGFWNVYGYGVQGLNPSGYIAFRNSNPATLNNYAGFYQDSTLYRFDTRRQWGVNSGPSYAVSYPANYNGCVINTQLWAIWAKRTNIPPGTYQIDLGVDDDADLFIDNQRIFNAGCCGNNTSVWIGTISGSTLVDVRGSNGNGPGYLTISLSTIVSPSYTLSGGTISGNQGVCIGTTATGFSNVTTASGSCTISYKWQSSTNNSTWTDITTATSAWFATATNGLGYTHPTPLTTTTYFRRFVTDACGQTAVSNTITVTVYPA